MSAHSRRARRQRAHQQQVQAEAHRYHEKRTTRLLAAGRKDKLKDTGFLRRYNKKFRTRKVKVLYQTSEDGINWSEAKPMSGITTYPRRK